MHTCDQAIRLARLFPGIVEKIDDDQPGSATDEFGFVSDSTFQQLLVPNVSGRSVKIEGLNL
jgi:hypothetical protein